jgi:hypothetical protein
MKLLLLLILVTACAHKNHPAPKVVVVTDPATLPIEVKEPPVVVLDKEPMKRELFTVQSSLDVVKKSVIVSNCVLNKKDFQDELSAVEKFDYSDRNGKQVLADLLDERPCIVSTYKTGNPWSKAVSTTYAGDKTHLYLNTRVIGRPFAGIVNSDFHECLHLKGYSHGDNSSIGKEKSVNYLAGAIAEKYSEGCL